MVEPPSATGCRRPDAAASGRTRRVGIVVPSFLMVPSLLESSNLICMLPSRCAPPNTGQRFAVFDPPIAIEGFPLHLAWHAPRDQDEGVQHVAGSCDRCCKLLLSQAGTAASVWRTQRRSSAERARCKLAGEPESTGKALRDQPEDRQEVEEAGLGGRCADTGPGGS